jgi:rhodanese-related sulfurtransferase
MLYGRAFHRLSSCLEPNLAASLASGLRRGLLLLAFVLATGPVLRAQAPQAPAPASASTVPQAHLIQPDALVKLLKGEPEQKPLILQVGPRVMFAQAHIPGAQYAGPGSQASGIQSLENTVSGLTKDRPIVLYCGCCPWDRCPNVGPAYKRLAQLGFTHVRVLYLATNFGDDWVSKGYPAVKGK